MLWCAVALGALVRGHPLAQVGAVIPSRRLCPLMLLRGVQVLAVFRVPWPLTVSAVIAAPPSRQYEVTTPDTVSEAGVILLQRGLCAVCLHLVPSSTVT